jgi:phage terminase large subunit-like protein
MNIQEIIIGVNNFELRIEEHPNIYGIIDKYGKDEKVFSIRYFINDIYQGTKFADTLQDAKIKLRDILQKLVASELKRKSVMTYELFRIIKQK